MPTVLVLQSSDPARKKQRVAELVAARPRTVQREAAGFRTPALGSARQQTRRRAQFNPSFANPDSDDATPSLRPSTQREPREPSPVSMVSCFCCIPLPSR